MLGRRGGLVLQDDLEWEHLDGGLNGVYYGRDTHYRLHKISLLIGGYLQSDEMAS